MTLSAVLIILSTQLYAQSLGGMNAGDTGSFLFPVTVPSSVSGSQAAQVQIIPPAGIAILPSSMLGPQSISPGKKYIFRIDFQAQTNFPSAGPRAMMNIMIQFSGSSVTPANFNWQLVSVNGFMTAQGTCTDSYGRFCGRFLSPDSTPPITTLGFLGPMFVQGNTTYISSSTTIQLSAVDPATSDADISGVEDIGYSISSATDFFSLTNLYLAPFSMPGGTYTLSYGSIDAAANAEVIHSRPLVVVGTPPGQPINLQANGSNPSPWRNSTQFSLTWTNPADPAGIGTAYVQVDGNIPVATLSTTAYILNLGAAASQGATFARVWLQDNVGNVDPTQSSLVTLRLDTVPPISQASSASTASAGPFPVTYTASDPGASAIPPTGSGLAQIILWSRRDLNGNGIFGAWQQYATVPLSGTSSRTGTISFLPPNNLDATYQFYTQAMDIAGNSEPAPTAGTPPKAQTFFDSTPATISGITLPSISPSLAALNWTTDDETLGFVDYGTSTAFGYRTAISSFSHTHAALLSSLLYPDAIYYQITAINETGLITTSPIASFNTPANVFVPTNVLGVADTSQPITVQINNPLLTSATVSIGGQNLVFDLTNSSTFQIFINPSQPGTQNVNVTVDGFSFNTQFLVDSATRSVRLARLVMDGGGVITSPQGAPGFSTFDSNNVLNLALGQPVQGPSTDQSQIPYFNSGMSRLHGGYYAGIDPIAPGAVSNLTAITGPSTGQITLTWTSPGNDGYVGQAMIYDLRQGTSPLSDVNFLQAATVSLSTYPAPASTVQTAIISGLNDSTTYYFALKTIDELLNVSTISNIATGVTYQVAKSTDFTNGQPTVEVMSTVPGLAISIVSTTTTNGAVALATSAAAAQGLLLVSQIYDVLTPVDPLPGGGVIAFQFDPGGFSLSEQQNLRIYHFNSTLGSWTLLQDSGPVAGQYVIFAQVTSLSFFAIMAADRIPPVTMFSAQGGKIYQNPDGILYATTATAFSLSAIDPPFGRLPGSGVAETDYNVDSSSNGFTSLNPASPKIALVPGLHEVQFHSIDKAGNIEPTQSAAVGVDVAPPVIALSVADGPYETLPNGILILSTFSAGGGPSILVVQTLDPLVPGGALDEGSGVSTVTYFVDNSGPNIGGSVLTIPVQPGLHSLGLIATDNVGNVLNLSTMPFRIVVGDIQPPRTAISISSPEAPGGPTGSIFVSSLTLFQLSSIDDLSVINDGVGLGVSSQELDVDGIIRATFQNSNPAVGQAFNSSFSLATDSDGIHTLGYFAQDTVGNREIMHISTVAVDNTPPQTSLTFSGGRQFITTSQFFASTTTSYGFDAVDPLVNGVASGVDFTRFAIDTPTFSEFGSNFYLSEGIRELFWQSQDRVQNLEVIRSTLIYVDGTAPVSTASVVGPQVVIANATPGVFGGPLFVATSTLIGLSSQDPLVNGVASGLNRIMFGIDQAPGMVFAASFPVVSEGTHTINFLGIDNVGNTENLKHLNVTVDATPPVTTVSFFGPYLSSGPCNVASNCPPGIAGGQPASVQVFVASSTVIALAAADPVSNGVASGVSVTRYRIDTGPWTVYGGAFGLGGEGVHTLQVQSQDRVLNAEAIQTFSIAVDQTPPVTTLTLGSPKLVLFGLNVITSNSPISLSAVDPLSQGDAVGVSQISYRIDGGPLTIYSSPFTLPQGMHTIDYGAIDRVQNVEGRKTLTVGVGDFITGGVSGVSFVTGSGTVGITGLVESNGAVNLTGNTLINGNVIAASVKTSGKAGVTGTITQGATPLVAEPISIDAITQLAQASNSNNLIPPAFLSAGVLTISGGKSLTLATGTYVVQGLNISGGGSLIAKGAVNILVQGQLQISGGQANISGPASNLVVFSGSSQGMNLSGGAQTVGIFYGHRGPLQITGNAQIGGSLFAQSATISGTVSFATGNSLPQSPGAVAKTDVNPPSSATGSSSMGTGNFIADPTFTLQDLYVFPNPAVGGAKPTIHVAVGIADQVTIRIFDMSGRQVQQVTITDPPQIITDGSGAKYAYEYKWNGHIPTGTYLYTIEAQKGGASSIHKSGKFAVVR